MGDRCRGGQTVQTGGFELCVVWGALEIEVILPVIEETKIGQQ